MPVSRKQMFPYCVCVTSLCAKPLHAVIVQYTEVLNACYRRVNLSITSFHLPDQKKIMIIFNSQQVTQAVLRIDTTGYEVSEVAKYNNE